MPTWDSRALKATPVTVDEILLIDTQDSRNQKRATLSSVLSGITTSNVGAGEGLALPPVGNDFPFKSLIGTAPIVLTGNANDVTFTLNALTNADLAVGVFSNITGIGTQTQALNMGTNLINSVVDPVAAQDAATKNYVDTLEANGMWTKSGSHISPTTLSDSVCVGTNIQNSPLHVFENTSDVGTTIGVTIQQAGTGDAVVQYLLTGGQRWVTGIDNSDGDKYKIASSLDLNSDARLTIDTSGNVGIGIQNPEEPLDVVGDMRLTNYRTRGLARTIPTTIDDAIDIGTFTFISGSGSLIITITVDLISYSVSKEYLLPVQSNQTAGAWEIALPISSTGDFNGNDFELEVNVSATTTSLRIRNSSSVLPGPAEILIKQEGDNTDTFVPSSTVNSVTAPTDIFGSTVLTQVNGNLGIGTNTPTEKMHLDGGNFLQTPLDPTLAGSLIDAVNLNDPQNVYVSGNYAYVTGEDSNSFVIIDVTDPTTPTLTGSLIDGTLLSGARGVFVSGQYAYVVASNTDRLTVIDLLDPTTPVIVGNLADGTNMNQPRSVYVSGNYAYVTGSISHSLAIIDIRDPTNPTLAGSLIDAINMNRASSVYVVGNYAYVTGELSDSLAVIDISNPTTPTLTDSLIDSVNMDAPRQVYVSGKYAYVIGFASDSLAVIDISDPFAITLASSLLDSTNLDGSGGVQVSGNYAYVTGSNGINIIDVTDRTTTPIIVGRLVNGLVGNGGIYVSGKYAYAALRTSDALAIVDISGINAPSASIGNVEAGYLSVTDNAVIGNDLYANSLSAGIGGIKSNADITMKSSLVSRISTNDKEIFTDEDWTAALNSSGELDTGIYRIKSNNVSITTKVIAAAGANVSIVGDGQLVTILNFDAAGVFSDSTAVGAFGNMAIRNIFVNLNGNNNEIAEHSTGGFFLENVFFNYTGTGTKKLGTINSANFILFEGAASGGFDEGWTITTADTSAILTSQFISDGTSTTPIFDFAAITNQLVVDTNTFGVTGTESIFNFDSGITNPIKIFGVTKVGTGVFYAPGSLDQTTPNVDAQGNTGSPDSTTTGEFDFLNIASPRLVTISATDTPVAIAGGAWSATELERVTADVGNNGIATITGLGTNKYAVNFSALIEKLTGGATNIALTVLVNGTDTTTNPPRSVNAGIIQISATRLFSLAENDTLQLAAFNTADTNNIEVSQATMSITRIA